MTEEKKQEKVDKFNFEMIYPTTQFGNIAVKWEQKSAQEGIDLSHRIWDKLVAKFGEPKAYFTPSSAKTLSNKSDKPVIKVTGKVKKVEDDTVELKSGKSFRVCKINLYEPNEKRYYNLTVSGNEGGLAYKQIKEDMVITTEGELNKVEKGDKVYYNVYKAKILNPKLEEKQEEPEVVNTPDDDIPF